MGHTIKDAVVANFQIFFQIKYSFYPKSCTNMYNFTVSLNENN